MDKLVISEAGVASTLDDLGGGKYRIRIIQPGPGSSGVYLTENLTKSLPVFTAGTQMYLDHPTATEEWDRPERSLRDLAAKFETDAWQEDDGSLVTDIFVYESFRQIIKEKWSDIGVSIHAWSYGIMGPNGEVPPFDGLESVDFVTKAGAGGAILELLEGAIMHDKIEENKLDKELLEAVRTGFAALSADIKEAVVPAPTPEVEDETPALSVSEALVIAQAIEAAGLPEGATARIISAVEAGGDYKEAIAGEVAYIATIRESDKAPAKIEESSKEPTRVAGFKKVVK